MNQQPEVLREFFLITVDTKMCKMNNDIQQMNEYEAQNEPGNLFIFGISVVFEDMKTLTKVVLPLWMEEFQIISRSPPLF